MTTQGLCSLRLGTDMARTGTGLHAPSDVCKPTSDWSFPQLVPRPVWSNLGSALCDNALGCPISSCLQQRQDALLRRKFVECSSLTDSNSALPPSLCHTLGNMETIPNCPPNP
mmetsp:Transcript_14813/g.26325  ORF Transcript_14813/g.26325 Transcript_14813/m.26325 type:complete len:113 (+) Transcript_14813:371-709(+)